MRSALIFTLLVLAANAKAEHFAIYGGKHLQGLRTNTPSSPNYHFGAEAQVTKISFVSLVGILDHTKFTVSGRGSDHITSLMVAPTVALEQDGIRVAVGLGLGAQLNFIEDWAFDDALTNSRISYIDSNRTYAFVISPRASIDFKITDSMFLGVQGSFHYSSYERAVSSTDLTTQVRTALPPEQINQSFFNTAIRIGWDL